MEWHQITDPASAELDRLAERYHLHPLHVEDCRHRLQAAKVEDGDGYLFVVLKPVSLREDGSLEMGDLDLFLGRDWLITVEETECRPLRAYLEQHAKNHAPGLRADQLLYRVIDVVVDSYLPILDRYSDVIDELQDETLEKPSPDVLAKIFATKRAMIELRRVLANMRDVAGHLQRHESDLIARDLWPFLRDVYDHLARNLDLVEMQRDILAGCIDVYLSSVANRTNQVMKVLTVLGTIALPALIISSFFGMNLKGLPWADSPRGTIDAVLWMVGSTVVLLGALKLFRWL